MVSALPVGSVWLGMLEVFSLRFPTIQKSGRQQPMHQESRGSVLAVATGHMSISLGLVFGEIPVLLALL